MQILIKGTKRLGDLQNLARRLSAFVDRDEILRSPKTKPRARKIPKRAHTTEAEKAAA